MSGTRSLRNKNEVEKRTEDVAQGTQEVTNIQLEKVHYVTTMALLFTEV